MEAKLIKQGGDYYITTHNETNLCYHLKNKELLEVAGVGEKSGEVHHNKGWNKNNEVVFIDTEHKLSLENCQAIERGYDLDELAIGYFKQIHMGFGIIEAYKKGFQEALEVNADKRFTLKEMVDCWNRALEFQTHKETLGEYIKSLQQTEWDVIVEMEGPLVYPANLPKEGEERPDYRPKLSENGCIILKRK